jgi:hypothetical protein
MVRARWARRGVVAPLPPPLPRSRGARPTSREIRELVAPSTMRLIARWSMYLATTQRTTISATLNVVDTIVSAERARKSLLVTL